MLASHSRFIFLCLILVTGGVVLSLELLASRILTPFFGVSLYIWTAILSITLTFLALGYQFGGWVTAKVEEKHHESLLLSIPIFSTLFIFLACLLYPIVFSELPGTGLVLGSFIGAFILLAFPLVLLSSANPVLIALFHQSSKGNDSGAGFVFFISTFGSVAGVLVTALLIIPNITNFSAMLVNGIFLGLFTIVTHFLTRKNRTDVVNKILWTGGIVAIVLCSSLLLWKDAYLGIVTSNINEKGVRFEILSEYPSHYGNLKVVGIIPEGKKELSHYILYQDGLTQNIVSKAGNSLHQSSYIMEALTNFMPHAKSALVLGLGAGVVARKLRGEGMKVSVVDINPDTLRAAKEYFFYKENGSNIFFEDARTFVKTCVDEYDIVVLDLFHGDGAPEHVTTKEFIQDVKTCLHKDGVLVSNAIIGFRNKVAKMSMLATFYSVFGNTHFFVGERQMDVANGYIVAAKTAPLPNITFSLADVPTDIRKKVVDTFRSYQSFDSTSFQNYRVISDNGNTYSSLFASSYMQYRQIIQSFTPARILIN